MKLITYLLLAAAIQAQTPPPTVLTMDVDIGLFYARDTPDWSKYGTQRGPVSQTPTANPPFADWFGLGDIVSINGKAVKGTWSSQALGLFWSPTPQPGQAIADTFRTGPLTCAMEILDLDGNHIGTIFGYGLNSGPAPPGAPKAHAILNMAITGGTGAYLGMRGQMGNATGRAPTVPARANASMAEDPSLRREHNAGQTRRHVLQLTPMTYPEILSVVHNSDFSPVTDSNPARAGETLTLWCANLGPVRASLDPGEPFPAEPLAIVNSPVEVVVNGRETAGFNQVGVPGETNRYRVDFRMPEGVSGPATLMVRAAFINGVPVRIPVR